METFNGMVIWFNAKKGYGFIKWDNGQDLFVHFSNINSNGFKHLSKNQNVTFKLGENKNGDPQAIEVTPLK